VIVSSVTTIYPCLDQPGKAPTLLPTPTRYHALDWLRPSEYGEKWPLTVQNGTLNCTPLGTLGIVKFTANGITYAVNGTAKARAKQNGWREIDEIWRDNPNPQYGPKINIGPIVEKGLSLCK
jgi:hypothetical protein